MAVYTDVTDAELEGFLADFDLGRPLVFKGIAEGVENSNFLVETDRGRYFLTVFERRVAADDLPFFFGLMQAIAQAGFPCPRPITDRAGRMLKTLRGKPAALVEFLSGLSVRRPSVAQCREAGDGLAWLHEAARGFEAKRADALGQSHWAAMFTPALAAAADRLKPGLAATIDADLALLARGWPAGLPRGIIHGDFFPDNVFFRDGRFAGAFDFYFAATDTLAYDIGVALNAWCFEPDGSFNVTAARTFIDGYRRRRALTDEEITALPLLAHGAAMRFFLTRLTDWGATPAGALVRPKDPMEYERKLAVHREAARAGAGLELLGGAR
ncbi:MAG TPA: homoserine kinase [Caulobacteraceae bacterium]